MSFTSLFPICTLAHRYLWSIMVVDGIRAESGHSVVSVQGGVEKDAEDTILWSTNDHGGGVAANPY